MKSFSKASKMAAVLTVTLACLSVTSAQAVVSKATVRSISGSATVSTDKGATWKPLRVGNSLTPNSIIKTAADTKVELVLNQNGPVVRVPADTTVGVDKLEPKVAAPGNASSDETEEATEIKVIEITGPVIKPETANTTTPFSLPKFTAIVDTTTGGISAIDVANRGNKLFTIDAAGNRFDVQDIDYSDNDYLVIIAAPPTGGRQAQAWVKIVNGKVDRVVVVDPGSGYTATPTVTLKDLPKLPQIIPATITQQYSASDREAKLKLVVEKGKIVDVLVEKRGENYWGFQNIDGITQIGDAEDVYVKFEGGDGKAEAMVTIKNGKITGVVLLDGGSKYDDLSTATIVDADGKPFLPFNPNLIADLTDIKDILKPKVVVPGAVVTLAYVPPPKAVAAVESTGSAKVTVTTVVNGVEVKTDKTVELFSLSTTKEIAFDKESAAQYVTVTKEIKDSSGVVTEAAVVFIEPPKVTVSAPTVKYAYNDVRTDLVPRGGSDDTDEFGRQIIRAAKVEAVLDSNGKIVGLIVVDPGYGYTSAPKITIEPPPVLTEEVKAIIVVAIQKNEIIVPPKVEAKVDKVLGGIVESITLPASKEVFTYEKNATYELSVEKPNDKNGTTARAVVKTDSDGKLILNSKGEVDVTMVDNGLGYDKPPKAFFTEKPKVERVNEVPTVEVVVVKKDEIINLSTLTKP